MTFSHHGDFGDIIYSLSAVRDLCVDCGPCDYWMYQSPYDCNKLSEKNFGQIVPLLMSQKYICAAGWSSGPRGMRLVTAYHQHIRDQKLNLSHSYYRYLGLDFPDDTRPWLEGIDPLVTGHVVLARSFRYRNPSFPWHEVIRRCGRFARFVGLDDEYRDFCESFGMVPRMPCRDMLDVARAIAGCRLFIGNQSAPRAVAESLKVPVLVEEFYASPDTHFKRPNAWYWIRSGNELPEFP